MELEKELKEINERLIRIEIRLENQQKESSNSRPFWVDFVISFLAVSLIFNVFLGIVSYLSN